MIKLDSYTLPKEDLKKSSHVTHSLGFANVIIFHRKSEIFCKSINAKIDYIFTHNFFFY